MKAALMRSPGVLDVDEVDDPLMPKGGVLLKVRACAVCGTDIKMLEVGHRDLTYPRIPGHEVTAQVLDTDSAMVRKGDLVQVWPGEACGNCVHCRTGNDHLCPQVKVMGFNTDGGMAEMMAVADPSRLVPIGKADPVLLTLAEPLACCINAQEKLRVGEGDSVLILGGGPMGCLNALLAKRRGAERVMLSEPVLERLRHVPKGLFDHVSQPKGDELEEMVRRGTDGGGADVIIPCTPNIRLDHNVLKLLAPGGRLCVFSGPRREDSPLPFDVRDVHYRE
ncbi:MAG: alcohol dehydrogenase catalytic domain-containing protein, partial [Methanomassiliicoccales archaeon]|nr:alcohol dehydrogenase catalytic domain-containing protein [Methanomassiliicoccales archaeon]